MPFLMNSYRFGVAGPVIGGPVTARYWQFYPLAWPESTDGVRLSTLWLAATPGGANLLAGGTATASHSSANAPNLIDSDTTTDWSTNVKTAGGAPGAIWIKVAATTDITPTEFAITAAASPNFVLAPSVWLVMSSADDVTYTPVKVCELPGGIFTASEKRASTLELQDFTNVESNARSWEFRVKDGPGNYWWAREAALHATHGGSARTGDLDFAYVTKPANIVGDNGKAKRWWDGSSASLIYTDDTSVANFKTNNRNGVVRSAPIGVIEEVRINPEGGDMPTALDFAWSVDGINYTVKKSFTGLGALGTGWTNNSFRSFDLR